MDHGGPKNITKPRKWRFSMKVSKLLMISLIAGLSLGQLTQAKLIPDNNIEDKLNSGRNIPTMTPDDLGSGSAMPKATRDQKTFKFSAEGNGEILTASVIPYNDQDPDGIFLEGGAKTLKVRTAPHDNENKPTVTFNVPAQFYDYNNKKSAPTLGFELQVDAKVEDENGKQMLTTLVFDLDFDALKSGEAACFTASDVLLWNAPASVEASCPVSGSSEESEAASEITDTLNATINSQNDTINSQNNIISSHQSSLETSKKTIATLENENSILREQMNLQDEQCKSCQDSASTNETTLDSLRNNVNTLHTAINVLTSTNNRLKASNEGLRETNSILKRQLQQPDIKM